MYKLNSSSVGSPDLCIGLDHGTAGSIDTDFEDDSEVEDSCLHFSQFSARRKSQTTISSFEEVHTPEAGSKGFYHLSYDDSNTMPVEGPQGPHLFRSSVDSFSTTTGFNARDQFNHFTESSMKINPSTIQLAGKNSMKDQPQEHIQLVSSSTEPKHILNLTNVALWTPQKISRWMNQAGVEPSMAEKFTENDISGAILITLKFEDLIELGIPSVGIRAKIWNEINLLRGYIPERSKLTTQIDEGALSTACEDLSDSSCRKQPYPSDEKLIQLKTSKNCHQKKVDFVTPSPKHVSIVEIEQMIPRPHRCAKGEKCLKWRKQQLLIENVIQEWCVDKIGDPSVNESSNVKLMIDSANDRDLKISAHENTFNSSKIDQVKTQLISPQLEEATLRKVHSRDPQENVKQFIQSQFKEVKSGECSPKAVVELSQYNGGSPTRYYGASGSDCCAVCSPTKKSSKQFSPHRMDRAAALSSELQNVTETYSAHNRLGTSLTEIDGPRPESTTRQTSRFVQSNLSNRHLPYIQKLPSVDENKTTNSVHTKVNQVTQAGRMMKRKAKMLRYDWQNYYFTLKGTQLAMRKDEDSIEALEYIDIDDYAIACSSFASGSKLNSALKAAVMSISRNKCHKQDDTTAFAFQLIPAAHEKSSRPAITLAALMALGRDTLSKNKTHHFAVRSCDERIDWMRELLLAKALNQKNQGYEININGNVT